MNFVRFFIIGLSIAVVASVLSCEDDTRSQDQNLAKTEELADDRITRAEIDKLRYEDYGLSLDSRNAIENWQKYNELIIQTENLKKADLTFFTNEPTLIRTFLNDLETEIPKQLQTNEILARVTVLETTMLKLNSLLTLNNIKKEDKLTAVKEYLISVSNLNLLINNKFEFDANNIIKPN